MDFVITVPPGAEANNLKISLLGSKTGNPENNTIALYHDNQQVQFIETDRTQCIIFGDLILGDSYGGYSGKIASRILREFNPTKLSELKGFFYLIRFEARTSVLEIYSSIFSILPVYYTETTQGYIFSSKSHLVNMFSDLGNSLNKSFLLEQALFNYPFRNKTIFANIFLVPSNSFVQFRKCKIEFIKHTAVEKYFVSDPEPWKESYKKLSDQFIDTVNKYIPGEEFASTLTGGFDSRTIVACLKGQGKDFKTYSFGNRTNHDIRIPNGFVNKYGIDHSSILLDENYIINEFLEMGSDLVRKSTANSSFLHVHFPYSAKVISGKMKILLNGMFGSELLRALHIRGMITTKPLTDLFLIENDDLFIDKLLQSNKLRYLRMDAFTDELDILIKELLDYRNSQNEGLTTNQKFYKYIFEESFRKFFGPQIYSQLPFITVRSPYLDFNFIKSMLKTELAGANNIFFTNNPLHRYKGQVLYGEIIKKTCPKLLYPRTGNGYRPSDIYKWYGQVNLGLAYTLKLLRKNLTKVNLDNLSIISAFNRHQDFFSNISIDTGLYDKTKIDADLTGERFYNNRDDIVQMLSTCHFIDLF